MWFAPTLICVVEKLFKFFVSQWKSKRCFYDCGDPLHKKPTPGHGPSGWIYAASAPKLHFCPRWGRAERRGVPLWRGASTGHPTGCPQTLDTARQEKRAYLREEGRIWNKNKGVNEGLKETICEISERLHTYKWLQSKLIFQVKSFISPHTVVRSKVWLMGSREKNKRQMTMNFSSQEVKTEGKKEVITHH